MRNAASGPDASRHTMTRRTLLRLGAAAGLSALAGCRPNAGSATASPPPAESPSAGTARPEAVAAALAQRGADAERSLISAYDEAITGHPELAALLVPLRADHVAHLAGLVPGATPNPGSSTAPGSAPASAARPAPGSASVLGSAPAGSAAPEQVTARLADLERTAAAARVDDLMTTPDGAGSLARLLASIGGCEASHAALLAASVAR